MRMVKPVLMGAMALVLLAGCQTRKEPEPTPTGVSEKAPVPTQITVLPGPGPESASYIINGQVVTLVDGKAETPVAPGSATMVTTTMFGEPVKGELNGDSEADFAVLLVQSQGGSGTFYYQAAALAQEGLYMGTNAELLGDRIAPQTTQIEDQTIIANFAERAEGEPMTTQPSVGVSKYFKVVGMMLTEIANPNQPPGQM